MGVLDDAIRQHLELKRQHGSDPTELARLEHEALGPAVREPAPAEEAGEPGPREPHYDADERSGPGAEPARPDAEPFPAEAEGEAPFDAEALSFDPGPRPASLDQPEPAAPTHEQSDPRRAEHGNGAGAAGHGGRSQDASPAGPQTEAYDVEQALAEEARHSEPPAAPAPEPEAGEDVLEETPEFLQETPEHDRLWFEQKPPKDFDFDG